MATQPSTAKTEPTKLRDSCNTCAVSKIKCSKEKPVCARCAKRGQRCEYFATRRAGRKHEPRQRQQDNGNDSNSSSNKSNNSDDSSDARSSVHVAISTTSDATNSFTPSWDVHMSDDMTYPSPSDAVSLDAPTLAGDDAASWRLLSAGIPDANDLFASFPLPEVPSQLFNPALGEGPKSASNDDNSGFDFGDFTGFLAPDTTLIMDETGFDAVDQFKLSTSWDSPSSPSLWSLSSVPSSTSSSLTAAPVLTTAISNSPPESRSFAPTAPPPPPPTPTSTPSPGCCLLRAMQLLTNLFPGSDACTCPTPSGTESRPTNPEFPTMQRVVTENKQTLAAIQAMLECPCADADNGYLVAIISLVVFKVLAWYKAAVKDLPAAGAPAADAGALSSSSSSSSMWKQQQHPGSPRSSISNRRDSDDKDALRRRRTRRSCHAERVVQTAVVIDGYRLDGQDQARMAAQLVLSELHRVQRLINVLGGRLKQDGPVAGGFGDMSFFSAAWFGQLETDLRKRVTSLSREIVDLLRQ